jgi:hypothetical protein
MTSLRASATIIVLRVVSAPSFNDRCRAHAHGAITPIAPIRLDTSKNRGLSGFRAVGQKGSWH